MTRPTLRVPLLSAVIANRFLNSWCNYLSHMRLIINCSLRRTPGRWLREICSTFLTRHQSMWLLSSSFDICPSLHWLSAVLHPKTSPITRQDLTRGANQHTFLFGSLIDQHFDNKEKNKNKKKKSCNGLIFRNVYGCLRTVMGSRRCTRELPVFWKWAPFDKK